MSAKNGKTKTAKTAKTEKPVEVETAETVEITAEMFDVVITRAGGSRRWRVSIEANEEHPTESGEIEVRTVRSLAEADAVVDEAIQNATVADDES